MTELELPYPSFYVCDIISGCFYLNLMRFGLWLFGTDDFENTVRLIVEVIRRFDAKALQEVIGKGVR